MNGLSLHRFTTNILIAENKQGGLHGSRALADHSLAR
jgi:hypothetical protein